MNRIIYRPKGRGYIICLVLLFLVLAAIIAMGLWLFTVNLVAAVILTAIATSGIIWAIIEVATYKLTITKEGITLSENRVLASIRQYKVELRYEGLCEIKRTFATGEDGSNVPAIALFYSNGVFKFLNVKRFNDKQINSIMSDIIKIAKISGCDITIT